MEEKRATIEITVNDGEVNFSVNNPGGEMNNPAFILALHMVKLATEGKEK